MYLHIGQNFIIKTNSIIGVFDMDTATIQKKTRDFLYEKEKINCIENVCSDLPKSFIVCSIQGKYKIFITSFNSSTILKRIKKATAKEDIFTNSI